jgi:ribosomal protein S18 acetylase RimI-like enzyme
MTSVAVRPLQASDYDQWLPLWALNNLGYVDDVVTASTWQRLLDPVFPVKGFAAWQKPMDGIEIMAGFVHFVSHYVTGHIEPVCYMQDLFVNPANRRSGIAHALVEALRRHAQREGFERLYWLAEGQNEAAQKLYEKLGIKLDFTFHVLPLA